MYKDVLGDLLNRSEKIFPKEKNEIEQKARMLYAEYCQQEKGKPKEVTMHTVKKIFPCIAFYKAITECTNQRERAYAIIDGYFTDSCKIYAKKLQKLCRIPFAYKLVPRIMASVIHKSFGEKSGFEMIEHQVKGKECHIDMIKCPYFTNCSAYGCPELTTVFCNSDDVSYGNMHPNLSWERKKTLGRGNDYCDFILKIKE